jgi:competence protein ComGC
MKMNRRFTWIEIIIIVAILAILTLWLFPRLIKQLDAYGLTNPNVKPEFTSSFGLI